MKYECNNCAGHIELDGFYSGALVNCPHCQKQTWLRVTAPKARCKCNHCPHQIEFDPTKAGETFTCPKCNMDTVLFIPKASSMFAPKQQPNIPILGNRPAAAQTDVGKILLGLWLIVGVIVTGYAMMMDISVPTESGNRVVNIGLANDRQIYLMFGIASVAVPAVLLAIKELGGKSNRR